MMINGIELTDQEEIVLRKALRKYRHDPAVADRILEILRYCYKTQATK